VKKACIVSSDIVSPFGDGVDACWEALLAGKSALAQTKRFHSKELQSCYIGAVEGVEYGKDESLVMQMLKPMLKRVKPLIPEDSKLILATVKGEIDLLERFLLEGKGSGDDSNLHCLLAKVRELLGLKDSGMVLSAACTSSTVALARAASMINDGTADCIAMIACDSVSEFVMSGFASMMALDKNRANPFDKNRKGLNLGEATAFALVMSSSRAKREGREIFGEVVGWGLSSDANHITGPSRNGYGLSLAIRKAIESSGIDASQINSISAHGTGTIFNDSMEMKAYRREFQNVSRPLYSIKGALGHTVGAAGLIESLIALKSLHDGVTPPNVNMKTVDDEASGWAFPESQKINRGGATLTANSGFGGINVALVLSEPS